MGSDLKRLVLRFADPEQEQARQAIIDVMSQNKDSRAKLKAAELILTHERDLHKHENPAVQKREVKHLLPAAPVQLIVKIARE